MKKYYSVSFKYSETTYCSNIAHAETTDAVKAHYSKYEWVNVEECGQPEVETAKKKGMPIIEIESKQEGVEMAYITTLDKPHEQYHRSKVIIHRDSQFHFADFNSIKQLDLFAETLGFTYKLLEEKPFLGDNENIYRRYGMSHNIKNELYGFWKREDVPKDAKPITALSNGSLVTCYFINDGKNITIYRPNPNATVENKNRYKTQEEYEKAVSNRVHYPNSLQFEAVYNPLPLAEHIAHHKIYGTY